MMQINDDAKERAAIAATDPLQQQINLLQAVVDAINEVLVSEYTLPRLASKLTKVRAFITETINKY